MVVAVLRNPNKQPSFSLDERLEQLRSVTSHLPQVQVTSFEGLTVHFALAARRPGDLARPAGLERFRV